MNDPEALSLFRYRTIVRIYVMFDSRRSLFRFAGQGPFSFITYLEAETALRYILKKIPEL